MRQTNVYQSGKRYFTEHGQAVVISDIIYSAGVSEAFVKNAKPHARVFSVPQDIFPRLQGAIENKNNTLRDAIIDLYLR